MEEPITNNEYTSDIQDINVEQSDSVGEDSYKDNEIKTILTIQPIVAEYDNLIQSAKILAAKLDEVIDYPIRDVSLAQKISEDLLQIFKEQPQKEKIVNGRLLLSNIANTNELDDSILLYNRWYRRIFGKNKKNSSDSKKRISIVKIKADTGKTIYREYKASRIKKDTAALTMKSITLLSDKDGNKPTRLTLSKGSWMCYYINHPDKAIRLSFRMGAISIALGLISIVDIFKDPIWRGIKGVIDMAIYVINVIWEWL